MTLLRLVTVILLLIAGIAHAQTSTFTYQGYLT